MQVKFEISDDILIVTFEGKLDTGTSTYAEAEIDKHLKAFNKIILDLKTTSFVSSAGLRVFLATAKKLMAQGGELRICNANPVVNEVLEMSGFSTILDVRKTLDEAVLGF